DLVGTLRYMSPEQALAKRVVVDHRTDIYALGATLYELLTLEPVFDGGDRQELLRQLTFEEPRHPRQRNRAIPVELETIVLKALEKNPADRYATAQELGDDLRRFIDGQPIRARPVGLVQQGVKWVRRRPALAAVYGLVVLALALSGLSGGAAWLWQNADAAHHEAANARDEAQSAFQQEQQARAGEAEARRKQEAVSYLYRANLAHTALADNDVLR